MIEAYYYSRSIYTYPFTPDAPKVFPDPDEVGQAIGYQRTLICNIESNPMPSKDPEEFQLYWSKEGSTVLEDDRSG